MNFLTDKENDSKLHNVCLALKLLAAVLMLCLYAYSLTRREDYYGGSHGFVKLGVITVMYATAIAAVLWRNTLSEKVNLIASAVLFCMTAFISYLIVECANSQWSALFVDGAGMSIKLHLCNGMIFVFGLLFVFFITSNLRTASIVIYLLSIFAGLLMYYVCIFRGTAFVATDIYSLQAAMSVGKEYDYNPDFGAYLAISIAVLFICLGAKFNGKIRFSKKIRIAMLVLALAVCGAFNYVYFHMDYTREMKVKLFKPQETYLKKGAMLTVVRSFNYLFPEKPDGYSKEKAKEIAKRYENAEDTSETETKKAPNLILIMDESLSDMASVSNGKITTNKEVLPVIKSLEENTYKGTLHEERRGGGTAIMEFETLTGDTNAFFPIGTIAYQTVIRTQTPSLASQLKDNGFRALIASHPNKGANYNRENAYPLLGFDTTRFKEDFIARGNDGLYGKYISDEAAFDELIDEYEENEKDNDSPFFAFQVTMQNHAPYDQAPKREIRITSKQYNIDSAEQYLNYAHESDRAFADLIKYFKNVDEPTLIVMFGDHAPRFDEMYYRKLLGTDEALTDKQEMQFQQTPIIFWANYNIGSKNLGDLSNNYVGGIIMDTMGIGKTGYQRFLAELKEDVPVINSLGYYGADGKFYDIDDRNSPYYEKIYEYRILEYNKLVDTKNRIEGFF